MRVDKPIAVGRGAKLDFCQSGWARSKEAVDVKLRRLAVALVTASAFNVVTLQPVHGVGRDPIAPPGSPPGRITGGATLPEQAADPTTGPPSFANPHGPKF